MKKVAILLSLIASLSADQLKVPSAYSTIQAGLNAARKSDTVLVAVGTYTENIIWPDVNGIRLISEGDSSNTIIDGGGVSSVIYMNPQTATIDTTTLIQGFKITNGGNVSNGGGFFCNNASPVLTKILITKDLYFRSLNDCVALAIIIIVTENGNAQALKINTRFNN